MAKFDADGYAREGLNLFYKYLEEFADKVVEDMKKYTHDSTWAADKFSSEVVRYMKQSVMRKGSKFNCIIGLQAAPEHIYYKAFIIAYGSGIHMNEKDNPWITEFRTGTYEGCKYWNAMRPKSNAIVYRPAGETYYDFYNNSFKEGHGPNKKGEYRALPLMSIKGQDSPWFNRALELNGITNKEHMDNKIKDMMIRAFNEVSAQKYFK